MVKILNLIKAFLKKLAPLFYSKKDNTKPTQRIEHTLNLNLPPEVIAAIQGRTPDDDRQNDGE